MSLIRIYQRWGRCFRELLDNAVENGGGGGDC